MRADILKSVLKKQHDRINVQEIKELQDNNELPNQQYENHSN